LFCFFKYFIVRFHFSEKLASICSKLHAEFENNPTELEFYLPQLIYLVLNNYDEMQVLKNFFLDKCKQSFHFALQTYLLIRSAKDSRGNSFVQSKTTKPKKKKKKKAKTNITQQQ
jgi:hypothetical protein